MAKAKAKVKKEVAAASTEPPAKGNRDLLLERLTLASSSQRGVNIPS